MPSNQREGGEGNGGEGGREGWKEGRRREPERSRLTSYSLNINYNVSSANDTNCMYKMNNPGPSTELCGTPYETPSGLGEKSHILINCFRNLFLFYTMHMVCFLLRRQSINQRAGCDGLDCMFETSANLVTFRKLPFAIPS